MASLLFTVKIFLVFMVLLLLFVQVFLSPGIEAQRVTEFAPGFNASQVSYAGMLPVSSSPGAQLFYFFFEARNGNNSAPLLVWLNGGPGETSSLGNFYELGPYSVNEDLTLSEREYSWNNFFHVLFLDQPIGTGFSARTGNMKFLKNETEVADDVYAFLQQFYLTYPQYLENDLYICGESYGGHYVPSVTLRIIEGNEAILAHQATANGSVLNLKGQSVGNGFSAPCEQVPYSPSVAHAAGLIDYNQYLTAEEAVVGLKAACEAGDLIASYVACGAVLGSILASAGEPNNEDMRIYTNYNYSSLLRLFNNMTIRHNLHVSEEDLFVMQNEEVAGSLLMDMMVSSSPKYTTILEKGLKVLLYHGNQDPAFSYMGQEAWIRNINWSGQEQFRKAHRSPWKERFTGKVAGYVASTLNLRFATVVNAGHLVPQDQPESALDMMERFVFDLPWD